MKDKRLEITGLLTITISLFILASLIGFNPGEEPTLSPNVAISNPMGIIGVYLAHFLIKICTGYIAFAFPLLGLLWGWWLFSKMPLAPLGRLTGHLLIILFLSSIGIGLVALMRNPYHPNFLYSGLAGGVIASTLHDFMGISGGILILGVLFLVVIRSYFSWNFYTPFQRVGERYQVCREHRIEKRQARATEAERRRHTQALLKKIDENQEPEQPVDLRPVRSQPVQPAPEPVLDELPETEIEPVPAPAPLGEPADLDYRSRLDALIPADDNGLPPPFPGATDAGEAPRPTAADGEDIKVDEEIVENEINIDKLKERKRPRRKYQLPSSDLLTTPEGASEGQTREELLERANFLIESLKTFGVEGKVVNVSPGPVITLFEVEPAEGVRISKFTALADDLARVMEASRVRVIAPIPGKSSVGIEIPNRNPATVYFKSVINSEKFAQSVSLLTLAVGKTTSGEIATMNLSKMPHLLIAGTTGSGKSVCLNTIICSILYQATPEQVKFVIIDPKKVEMTMYRALQGYHLLAMEDIDEPIVTSPENSVLALRAVEAEMGRRYDMLAERVVRNIDEYNKKVLEADETIMPYIIVVIDELADLMLMSAKDVETPIARLAQLARAVGIHLVIATQRPSVDVITGVIKANFPSRIAFQVASKIDSRTILDTQGAEKLIGRGDMLYLGTGAGELVRMHNAFIALDEIEAIMEHIKSQPLAGELILPSIREISAAGDSFDNGVHDSLFDEAVQLVVTHQQGSISLLQRRLKVGYSRAARLIDEMEQAGIVGPFTGSKAREVLVDDTYLDGLYIGK
ncbi:MAG: DNA translocase FtsK 4TM domain-containing protein [Candidatus Neomarinimicrobiota bacterium]